MYTCTCTCMCLVDVAALTCISGFAFISSHKANLFGEFRCKEEIRDPDV